MRKIMLFMCFLFFPMVVNAAIISKSEYKFYEMCPDLSTDGDCISGSYPIPLGYLTVEINTSVVDSNPVDGDAFFEDALLSVTFYDVLSDKFYHSAGVSDLRTDGLNAHDSAIKIADPDSWLIDYYIATISPELVLFDDEGASVYFYAALMFHTAPSLGLSLVDLNEVGELGMDGTTYMMIDDAGFFGNDGKVLSVTSVPEPAGIALALLGLLVVGFQRRIT